MKRLIRIIMALVLILVLCFALVACSTTESSIIDNELFQQFMAVLIPIIAAALGTAITAAVTAFTKYVSEKTKSERLKKYMVALEETVYDVVQALNQKEVLALKEAAEDGKLTTEEISRISKSALDTVLAILGVAGVEILSKVYTDVNEMIANKIERVVLELKPAPVGAAA
jgi:ABC-type multidrug transport system fused ATPase/permease subunit